MGLRLIAGSKTDVGKQREQNEDACYSLVAQSDRHASGLFVVADGMGGYHAGEVASQLAVETLRDTLLHLLGATSEQKTIPLNSRAARGRGQKKSPEKLSRGGKQEPIEAHAGGHEHSRDEKPGARVTQPLGRDQGAVTRELNESPLVANFSDVLADAVTECNKALVAYGKEHADARDMGSTLTAVLVIHGTAFIANVGDSRTYLLRDGKLTRITRDHSLVQRLVESGQIQPEEVYDHPNRNLIYRSLSANSKGVDVDTFMEMLQPRDALLLCSDGLWEMVRDPQMESILNEVSDPGEACEVLIERANENGGEDNITAVLVRCEEV